jgi:hypothetical protein
VIGLKVDLPSEMVVIREFQSFVVGNAASISETDGSHGHAVEIDILPFPTENDLGASAADIDDQRLFLGSDRSENTETYQSGLFVSGDYTDLHAVRSDGIQKVFLVDCVPGGAGGHGDDPVGTHLPGDLGEIGDDQTGLLYGVAVDVPAGIEVLSETDDLLILEHHGSHGAFVEPDDEQMHRIGADIDETDRLAVNAVRAKHPCVR